MNFTRGCVWPTARVENAVENVITGGLLTRDLGGFATANEFTNPVLSKL